MSKCKPTKATIIVVLAILLALTVGTVAFFADRVTHQMQFTTATFTDNGYTITREAPSGPYAAGETITVPIKETNTGAEDIKSSIQMKITWSSPDTARSIFGNAAAADNAVLKLGSETLDYEVSQDKKSITFTLPDQVLGTTAGTKSVTRDLHLTIPESFVSTGNVTFTFTDATVSQQPVGFSASYDSAKLSALQCATQVVWAASEPTGQLNSHKALYGYLNETCDGIIYKMGFGYNRSAMKDFANTSASKWSNYKSVIKTLSFPEGMTTVGDYAFDGFTKVTSVSFPSTTEGIGQYAFNASGLTGTLTIPATVNTIEERAFGLLPNVTTITFNHTDSDVLTLPANRTTNSTNGAFYVSSHVDTVVNTANEDIMYEYGWHDGWDNRRLIPHFSASDTWIFDYESYDYVSWVDISILETINIVDHYMPAAGSYQKAWDISNGTTAPGTVTAYLSTDGKTITIAGNGYGLVYMNEDCMYTFAGLESVKAINGADLLDTRNVTTMESMFQDCAALKTLDGIDTWNTGKVENMSSMFRDCGSLVSLDLHTHTETAKDGSGPYTAWNTENVETVFGMFSMYGTYDEDYQPNAALTTLNVTGWDVTNLAYAGSFIQLCPNLTTISGIDGWTPTALQEADYMFYVLPKLQELDVSGWTGMTELYNTRAMFYQCEALTEIDISAWDMSAVTESRDMFGYCINLKALEIPASLTTLGREFAANCTSLTTITFLDTTNATIEFPEAGESYGAFYVEDYLETTFNFNGNESAEDYNWVSDNRVLLVPTKLTIEVQPTKTTYTAGDNFDKTGMKVIADFNDGTRKYVTSSCVIEDGDNLPEGKTTVTVAYTLNGVTVKATVAITVENANITITYDANGGTYVDGTTKNVISYAQPAVLETVKKTSKTSNVSADGSSFSGTYGVNTAGTNDVITIPGADSLKVTVKYQTYTSSDYVAVYDNSTTPTTSNYADSISNRLYGKTETTKTYTVAGDTVQIFWKSSYDKEYLGYYAVVEGIVRTPEDGEHKALSRKVGCKFQGWYTNAACTTGNEFDISKASSDATVYAKWYSLDKIAVTKAPTKTTYLEGDAFDKTGMEVTAYYSDGTSKTITSYTVANSSALVAGNTIEISYTELGITRTCTTPVTVNSGSMYLAREQTWYKSTTNKTSITAVYLQNSYSSSYDSVSWNADAANSGTIKAYINGTTLYICKNGISTMYANPNSKGAFKNLSSMSSFNNASNLDTSKATDLSSLFENCYVLTSLDVSSWNTEAATNMSSMFLSCNKLTSLSVSHFDTQNVTTMEAMFRGCYVLTSLDVSKFDTSNVTTMAKMFQNCRALSSLNISTWDTGSVTSMEYLFGDCPSLSTLTGLNKLDTSNVTTMADMFWKCSLSSIDLTPQTVTISANAKYPNGRTYTSWDTGSVTNMQAMFNECTSSLNINSLDTSKVTDMKGMFAYYNKSSFSVTPTKVTVLANAKYPNGRTYTSWDTRNVTTINYMFRWGSMSTVDLSFFNTEKLTDIGRLFADCSNLRTVYVSDLWDNTAMTGTNTFNLCSTYLCGGNGTYWNSANITATYARIDKAGQPGYFTYKAAPAAASVMSFSSSGNSLDSISIQ